ncbi:phosphopantetheine-binding protein [Longispora sp. NPDC051575]|uniref:phosphopantetheine-binding protein n=1 Tax=Longispora sp. NPDC051575 TaxID=3154943 RepID=UPI0034412AED
MTLDELRTQVSDVLGETPGDDESLIDAGLDSIRLMSLMEVWRADGHHVTFLDLADQPTLAGWARLLA